MYQIFIIVLEECPYSEAAIKLLKTNKIKFKSLKVSRSEKDKYVTSEINTFPQIYLRKTTNSDSLLLGGYTDLKKFFDTFINKKYDIKNVDKFNKEYPLWNKHSILRLIELINYKNIKS